MTPTACRMCDRVGAEGDGDGFIAEMAVTRAYLAEDQFFPGWVYVVLRRHATELYELSAPERAALIEDVNAVAHALARVYRPAKMNYELLGNQVAHIHWHVIPRLPDDPDPRWPVWRTEHERRELAPAERRARIAAIREALRA
jgi:diadenosine tetraphosphate (Ap4A) HIT family hydrolase